MSTLEKKVDWLIDYVTSNSLKEKEALLKELTALRGVKFEPEHEPERVKKPLRVVIEDYLTDCCIPSNIAGYQYLVSAIMLLLEHLEYSREFVRTVYPEVAKIHNTTPARVERSIRHAVETGFNRTELSIASEVSGLQSKFPTVDVPTNSEFICRSVQLISRKVGEYNAT